jgi:Acetyltransferase (GNAT) family
MSQLTIPDQPVLRQFNKDILIKGQPGQIECVEILGQTFTVTKGPVTVISLEDEWYEDLRDPAAVVAALKEQTDLTPDVLTFWQRLPDITPKYNYHQEWEEIAVLPSKSYADWFNRQIKSRVRSQIRKSEKEGVVVRETSYDDDFVRGMTAIFNEAPVRQGRRFWHYGKDFETVKRQFSRYIHREHMIGAYYRDEMIGLIMLGNAGSFGLTGQIISSIKHRDKGTNNALVAKAVEACERLGLEHLVYLFWSDDSLSEFKRRCGFEKTRVPRYYVPLTAKGKIGLKIGAQRGWKAMVPKQIKAPLKRLRSSWYESRGE